MTTIFVDLKERHRVAKCRQSGTGAQDVGDIWHTLPRGVVGPGFNDEFGDTFGIIYGFTADGFTQRELRDHVEAVRSQAAATCPTCRRSR